MVQLKHTLLLPIAFFTSLVAASPTIERRQNGFHTLSTDEINDYNPYAYFAAAAYCSPEQTNSWNCGVNCAQADSTFKPTASGGDGSGTPYWYVGYSPALKSVIVAHQGSNEATAENIAADSTANLSPFDPTLFPKFNGSIKGQSDFQNLQASTASSISDAIKQTLSNTGINSITFVGHGIGAAISLIDSLYNLDKPYEGINNKIVLFSLPRVGNQVFANLLDQNFKNLVHINNKEDYVPTIPSQSLGYVQPSGEIHIQDDNTWVACPGQDNDSDLCSAGDVTDRGDSNPADYYGPYNGINIQC